MKLKSKSLTNTTNLWKLGQREWEPTLKVIQTFLSLPVPPRPAFGPPPMIRGWQAWNHHTEKWEKINYQEIGPAVTLDFEAQQQAAGNWLPILCCAFDGRWLVCTPEIDTSKQFSFPSGRVVIGHNIAAYDRRYLSSEYTIKSSTYFLDTMQLGCIMHGMSESEGNDIRITYKNFKAKAEDGKPVPYWVDRVSDLSLKAMVEHHLGVEWGKKIDKTLRAELSLPKDGEPHKIDAHSLFEYCLTDVETTHALAQATFPKVQKLWAPHPVTWIGMGRVNQSRYYLRDWDQFQAQAEGEYQEVNGRLSRLVGRLVDRATPELFPQFDWSKFSKGKNKGKERWKSDLSAVPMNGHVDIELLRLRWEGHPVEWRKGVKNPNWWANGYPLPHPSGSYDSNLGSPLCKDYLPHALSGKLTSDVIPQNTLIELFNLITSKSQWESYRSRYAELYALPDLFNQRITTCVADLNGTGTLSRRSTSNVWVVLPKGKENKIGSNVMDHIVAPTGQDLVSADFVSQESRIACMMADVRKGLHNCCEWTKAVFSGDKSQGTDCHTLTAKRFTISRPDGKTLNFQLQYGGGLSRLVHALMLLKGLEREEAVRVASEFLAWYKSEAVALPVFAALSYLSQVPGVRTYLLGVKCPDTIDAEYVPDKRRSFVTTRNNWHIQSGAVDELHTLIFLIEQIAKKRGLSPTFACAVHDRIAFFSPKNESESLKQVFDDAMSFLMIIAYEAMWEHWTSLDDRTDRPVLLPQKNWLKFEKVLVSDCLSE